MNAETVLGTIAASTARRVSLEKKKIPEEVLQAKAFAAPPCRDAEAALKPNGKKPRVIAEIKKASPSEGTLSLGLDPARTAQDYEDAGAAAVSVLTEPEFFSGALSDLAAARARISVPLLMKDFLLEPYQLLQAKTAGADIALLIVALLGGKETERMLEAAKALGLHALVEVHDEEELEAAFSAGARLVGVNNRNLKTLEIDLAVGKRLAEKAAGRAVRLVCESGLKTRADIDSMASSGFDAFLIGSHLIKSGCPGAALKELLA